MLNTTILEKSNSNTTSYHEYENEEYSDYYVLLLKINEHEVKQMLPVILFYAFILILGLFGNFLVLVVYTFRYKRSQARVFILFLATIDFLMCLFGLPYQMFDMTHPYLYTNTVLCKIWTFIMITLFHISVFGLVVIAVDRYTKICHPLGKFHTQYFGKRRACVIAVILGILLSWPILFLYGSAEMETGVFNITGHACFYEVTDPDSNITLIYSTATVCFCVGSTVCLIILYSCVCYRIYSRYRKGVSLRSIQQHAEDSTCYMSDDRGRRSVVEANHEDGDDPNQNENNQGMTTLLTVPSKGVQFADLGKEEACVTDSECEIEYMEQTINRNETEDTNKERTYQRFPKPGKQEQTSKILPMFYTESIPESPVSYSENYEMFNLHNVSVVRNGKNHLLDSKTKKEAFIPKKTDGSLNRQSSISLKELNGRDELGPSSRRLYKFIHPKAHRDVIGQRRRHSCNERLAGRQGERLSLPLNGLNTSSSKTSINSFKSANSQADGGLRIHGGSMYNKSSRIKNGQITHRGHSKITKIMITITTVFILSYTPTLIIIIWSNLRPEIWDIISIHETLIFEFCLRFYLINNICNPFIYGFWDKRFKREVVFSFRKLFSNLKCVNLK